MKSTEHNDILTFEKVLNEIFDIMRDKRNTYRYFEITSEDQDVNRLYQIVNKQMHELLSYKQEKMLEEAKRRLVIDEMKRINSRLQDLE